LLKRHTECRRDLVYGGFFMRFARAPRFRLFATASCMFIFTTPAWAGAPPLPKAVAIEVDIFGRHFPHALGIIKDAEAAVGERRLAEAASLFGKARELAPASSFAHRRHCQVLTVLGRRAEAIAACQAAVQYGRMSSDFRAMVGALMAGSNPPTVSELASALSTAKAAEEHLRGHPPGPAAFADIGRRLGDVTMTRHYVMELQRLAPRDYETQRALALAPRPHYWPRALGLAAVVLVAAMALGRTVQRFLAGARRRTTTVLGLFLAFAAGTIALPRSAVGAQPSVPAGSAPTAGKPAFNPLETLSDDFPTDETDPEKTVPSKEDVAKNPIQYAYWMMDVIARAEKAEAKGDHKTAAKFWRALARGVPERSLPFGKLCATYQILKERDKALAACRVALGLDGVRVEDYLRFVVLLLDHPGPVTKDETEDVTEIVKHLRGIPEAGTGADLVECQLAHRVQNFVLLAQCTARLAVAAPEDPKTISFQWAMALHKGNAPEAYRMIERATLAKASPELIQMMRKGTRALHRGPGPFVYAGAALLVVGVVLFVVIRRRNGSRQNRPHLPAGGVGSAA